MQEMFDYSLALLRLSRENSQLLPNDKAGWNCGQMEKMETGRRNFFSFAASCR